MNFAKLTRLPKRLEQDLKIIRLAKNWREVLSAKMKCAPIFGVRLRNGVVLTSPEEVDLNFLFHEIWIEEFYAPRGYEIRAGDTIVDIGANIGVFAMYAATKAPRTKVFSFEPFPKNAEYFVRNQMSSRVDNVTFFPVAVADAEGSRTLHLDESWILHSLTRKGSEEKGISVDCVSLDTAFADLDVCDLLKLDCEGGEYEILYSTSDQAFGKIDRIVCEYNIIDSDTKNGDALCDFLKQRGFTVEEVRPLDPGSGFLCARR